MNASPLLAGCPAAPPELRETHSAIVVLVGDRVYKFKKHVNLGFLDFSEPEARELACKEELRLNRRIAPDVYLDTVSVTGSSGRGLEHGLLMRRMPEERRLSTLVRQGCAVDDDLRRLARLMADFHAGANRGADIAETAGPRGLRRRWNNNLDETERFRGSVFDARVHTRIRELADRYITGRAGMLEERAESGLAVDGHADLQAEDVFCFPDHPRVLDCLEFDDKLRWVDVLDDVCFLVMDLEHLGRPDLGRLFLDDYLAASGTPTVPSLEHHFVAYRAFVRAKVCAIRVEQGDVRARAHAASFSDQALRHLEAGDVQLVLVGGAPGTGKTTVAKAVAERFDMAVLSTDDVRRDLPARTDRYSPEAKAEVYRALLRRAEQALAGGRSVVADATWGEAGLRSVAQQVAQRTASRLRSIECELPVPLAAARAQRRLDAGASTSEAGAAVSRTLAATRDPWPEAIPLDTSADIARTVEAASDMLTDPALRVTAKM